MATNDSPSSRNKPEPANGAAKWASSAANAQVPQPLRGAGTDAPDQDHAGASLAVDNAGTTHRPRIAILIAEGFDGESAETIYDGLVEVGAVPMYVSTHVGSVTSVQGTPSQAEVAIENLPPILFEGLVVPGGKDHILLLCELTYVLEFVREQHRLTRPILALHDGAALIEKAGLPAPINPEQPEPGLFIGMHATADAALPDFLTAMASQRQAVAPTAE
jgi:putative intracellular protease/amidase